jgi:hypothetical protein
VDDPDPAIVKRLIDSGAKVDEHPSGDVCMLEFAIMKRKPDIIEMLKNAGAV